ncbi:MAG TPA: serine hydrolase domain-containing protein [Trebonia sp.]|jgi:D-alanyl-D-alanine carboxypeptidase|nr:serine hydrolase domain-containing protein [Trebonia sp.]
MNFTRSSARRRVLRITGVLTGVVMVAGGSSAYAFAAQGGSGQQVSAQSVPGRPPAGLQEVANQMVAAGAPGVIIMSRNGRQVSHVVAGLADKATRQPMQPQDKVYIASITKTFTATVVLQLAAEGRLSLDDSVQQLLPGVITGHGYDPARITARQLLQQTSGIRDYVDAPGFLTPQGLQKTYQPQQLVDIALQQGPPVSGWLYSNTNYILLGMIIQKVTGQSPGTEISRRILTPLRLRDTSFPLTRTQITAPYAHGYYGPVDVTNAVNPSAPWTAGAMISTVDDVARFYRALLTGRLLPPAQQRELLATIPVNDTGELFAEHYGLGIYSVQLSCGTAWGHDGGAPQGYKTIAYTSQDGSRQAVMIYNSYSMSVPPPGGTETAAFERDQRNALDIAFCGQR